MIEVRVIARSVARKGKEDELRALLKGMLVPTGIARRALRGKHPKKDSDRRLPETLTTLNTSSVSPRETK